MGDWFKRLFIDESKPAMSRHSGGNSNFPDVSTADNGRFLQVVDGFPMYVDVTDAAETGM
jgi:hypothetical protein